MSYIGINTFQHIPALDEILIDSEFIKPGVHNSQEYSSYRIL